MRLLLFFLLSVASLAMAQQAPVDKVSVLADGKLLLNGSEATIQSLSTEFEHLKSSGGAVWYYRANPQSEPPSQAVEVIKLVIRNRLPVSMSSKPDFSDVIDENGVSHPRKP